jgi:RNase P subunit RPR2
MVESSKTCSKCKETKSLSSFHNSKFHKDGKWYMCKSCKGVYDRRRGSEYRQRLKKTVYDHYGYTCKCCGETETLFLCIDHINGDGSAHRHQITNGRPHWQGCGPDTYRWIIKHNFPSTFQVLCHNCNWAKSRGGCPHQKTSRLAATQS